MPEESLGSGWLSDAQLNDYRRHASRRLTQTNYNLFAEITLLMEREMTLQTAQASAGPDCRDDTPAGGSILNVKLEAARAFILAERYDVARAILATMKASPTARRWLAKLDELAPEETGSVSAWEYLEVYVRASEHCPPADLSAVLSEQQATTADHAYTRLLNQYGAAGWELVSEALQGGDFVRLLFKRPARRS